MPGNLLRVFSINQKPSMETAHSLQSSSRGSPQTALMLFLFCSHLTTFLPLKPVSFLCTWDFTDEYKTSLHHLTAPAFISSDASSPHQPFTPTDASSTHQPFTPTDASSPHQPSSLLTPAHRTRPSDLSIPSSHIVRCHCSGNRSWVYKHPLSSEITNLCITVFVFSQHFLCETL